MTYQFRSAYVRPEKEHPLFNSPLLNIDVTGKAKAAEAMAMVAERCQERRQLFAYAKQVRALNRLMPAKPERNVYDVTATVPELPGLADKGKGKGKGHKKSAGRQMILTPPVSEKPSATSEPLADSNVRTGYEFGDLADTAVNDNFSLLDYPPTEELQEYLRELRIKMAKVRQTNWMSNRMALSQQASRFELPMDMKVLEQITPQDYLRKYCIVTSRRMNLYSKIFVKHKDKSNCLNKSTLENCLRETLIQALKDTTYPDLCELLEINDNTVIDFKLFAGVAAIAERILYPHYTTDDTIDRPEYQRERIETADFEALDWKLHGININDKMRQLLKMIE